MPPDVFDRLKLSSTCQHVRYISMTRVGGASGVDNNVSSMRYPAACSVRAGEQVKE